jgi:flavin reductase (DIM6/NTAB) family NADH-FMN oxidoreductase RutF
MTQAVDPGLFRAVMSKFATGVTVVTYLNNDQPAGMTANAFLSVSLVPPLVLISVRRTSRFVEYVKAGDRYGVSFLADRQEGLSSYFSRRPAADTAALFTFVSGMPLIKASLAHIVARVVDVHAAGDHLLFIGEVEHIAVGEDARPLIFFGGKYKQVTAHDPVTIWHAADGW